MARLLLKLAVEGALEALEALLPHPVPAEQAEAEMQIVEMELLELMD